MCVSSAVGNALCEMFCFALTLMSLDQYNTYPPPPPPNCQRFKLDSESLGN